MTGPYPLSSLRPLTAPYPMLPLLYKVRAPEPGRGITPGPDRLNKAPRKAPSADPLVWPSCWHCRFRSVGSMHRVIIDHCAHTCICFHTFLHCSVICPWIPVCDMYWRWLTPCPSFLQINLQARQSTLPTTSGSTYLSSSSWPIPPLLSACLPRRAGVTMPLCWSSSRLCRRPLGLSSGNTVASRSNRTGYIQLLCTADLLPHSDSHTGLPFICCEPPVRYLNEPDAANLFIARSIESLPVDSETGGEASGVADVAPLTSTLVHFATLAASTTLLLKNLPARLLHSSEHPSCRPAC